MFEITFEEIDQLAKKYPMFTEEQLKKGTRHIVDAVLHEIDKEILNSLSNVGQRKLDQLKKKNF